MFMRCSVRDHLLLGKAGCMLPITAVGHRLAVDLGVHFGNRLRSVHARPFLSTMETASGLAAGADLNATPIQDKLRQSRHWYWQVELTRLNLLPVE
jgi:hypothetical protein